MHGKDWWRSTVNKNEAYGRSANAFSYYFHARHACISTTLHSLNQSYPWYSWPRKPANRRVTFSISRERCRPSYVTVLASQFTGWQLRCYSALKYDTNYHYPEDQSAHWVLRPTLLSRHDIMTSFLWYQFDDGQINVTGHNSTANHRADSPYLSRYDSHRTIDIAEHRRETDKKHCQWLLTPIVKCLPHIILSAKFSAQSINGISLLSCWLWIMTASSRQMTAWAQSSNWKIIIIQVYLNLPLRISDELLPTV